MPPRACGPAPPIDTEYPTLEQVEKGFKAHALANGYSLVPKSYYPTKQTASRAIYRCAKGSKAPRKGNPDMHPSKKRRTSTQMTGCPFTVTVKRRRSDGVWAILPPLNAQVTEHNHGWVEPEAFAAARASQLVPRRDDIVAWYKVGGRPREIVQRLASLDPPITGVTDKDVTNLLAKWRRDEPQG